MAPSPPPTRLCPRCGVTYPGDAAFCPADGTALTSPRKEDPYLGTVVGKDVELREVLGAGAMGKVYRGHQHGTGRDVAVKILHDELSGRSQLVQRFYREAKIAGRLRHPHVVEVYFTGDIPNATPPASYIVMEFLEGRNLQQELVACGGKLPLERAIGLVLQMCDAVGEGHRQGIVHRDLKPENVMYDPGSHVVKLLDFGIAADTEASPDQRLTRAGFFVGTLMYVAPEALSGELVGPAADQYSLATIAYYLLAGVLPYTGKSPRELFSQLLTQPPISLNKAKPSLTFPASVEAVVMKALSKQPSERYPSVKAFSEAFTVAAQDCSSGGNASAPESSGGEPKGGLMGKMRGLFGR